MPSRNGPVHVATTKRTHKGKVYQTHLLRRSYRENGKVKHQTLGNLSHLPDDLIELIRRRLQGEPLPQPPGQDRTQWKITRSLPHGHVAAVLGTLQNIGLENVLASRRSRQRDVTVAMIVARILSPASKLATARCMREETAASSLALELGLETVTDRELYEAMDWLLARQTRIENKLAKKHLRDGTLVLYDVSSSYYTGRRCGLVQFGHNRDGKNGFPQIVYGLLCAADGCPVAIEVFAGNTADPNTLAAQIEKIRRRFGVERVVMVGDRGMITSRRIDEDLCKIDGLDWITALRADNIKKLVAQGCIQPSLFDQRDLAEASSPEYPGERLIVCRNPLLADERVRKREELLAATERDLAKIAAAVARPKRALRGKEKIGLRVGKVLNQHKVAKHFVLEIEEARFSYRRDDAKIAEEAALDGFYVIRTSVEADRFSPEDAVRAYKDLAKVERAFRSLKTVDLKVRPIYHRLDDRIRAHVFLCMLAYYVEWHLRERLASILFDDHDKAEAARLRRSIVSPAERSDAARRKDATKRTEEDEPVHSFQTLLMDLGTLCKNRVRLVGGAAGEADKGGESGSVGGSVEYYELTEATRLQRRVFELLGVPITV